MFLAILLLSGEVWAELGFFFLDRTGPLFFLFLAELGRSAELGFIGLGRNWLKARSFSGLKILIAKMHSRGLELASLQRPSL